MVVGFAQKFAPNSNEITLKQAELTIEGIKQIAMDCPSELAKYDILVKLYGLMTIGSSIIFVKVIRTLLMLRVPVNKYNRSAILL